MSDLPMQQVDHPAHNMPPAMAKTSQREIGIMKLKNAMYGSQEDNGSFNYQDSMYNTQTADPIARPDK